MLYSTQLNGIVDKTWLGKSNDLFLSDVFVLHGISVVCGIEHEIYDYKDKINYFHADRLDTKSVKHIVFIRLIISG